MNYFYIQKQINVQSLNRVFFAHVHTVTGAHSGHNCIRRSCINVVAMQQKESPSDLFSSRTLVMAGRHLSKWANPEWSSST